MLSSHFATASTRSPNSASNPSSSRVARAATRKSLPQRTNMALPWCSPACATSGTSSSMKVLIVGGGGREHALAWKCAQSTRVSHVYVAPGNAGTALESGMSNVDIAADDIDALLRFAQREGIDLTVVGPEGPLVAGIVDRFAACNLPCFGPTR